MSEEKKDPFYRFIIGGIAGISAKTSVAPLDRVKILIQGRKKNYIHLGPSKILVEVYKENGIKGLFQGNLAQLLRVFPYSAIQFLTFSMYGDACKSIGLSTKIGLEKFVSGALAGMTACTLTYPLDLIRARIAFQDKHSQFNFFANKENVLTDVSFYGPDLEIQSNKTTSPLVSNHHNNHNHHHHNHNHHHHHHHPHPHHHQHYRGIIHAFFTIIKNENGISGLYKGFSPTLIGMAPYAGASFYTFENLKKLSLIYIDKPYFFKIEKGSTKHLNIYGNLICGSIAGLVAQTVSYPLDVVRRTMQLNVNKGAYHRSDGKKRTWFTVMQKLINKYGITNGLFRGMTINYIRVVPVVSVSFTVYETLINKI